ncbi:DUF4276 family protein [Gimesia sp.]|uniref:DUF4276 family protein n=1 Tax=Gimesia sp. TaxID=2024833 RepID=UPI000C3D4CBE|nr:DUF4276 family protein [Gimesia sp.]MAX35675.1 hypothetical protein [Gimesia sp.]HAH47708.1 hypothetical protein [Planctomycetaceae bacterium]HBL46000.1 hypothetical protein [Planctomycetaceae bacterium]|tara:strand:- start:104 stop:799 length:696 start_codon:yes stop_codon:yes gene_type:complete
MKELYVFCEGPTEQGFCQQVLRPFLFPQSEGIIHTILIANSRKRNVISRGGIRKYAPLRNDIINTLNQHQRSNVHFTTLFDLYALPPDFPGKAIQQRNPHDPHPYVAALETALGEDIGDHRFLPYLQLHEYETLLFADVNSFQYAFENCDEEIAQLQAIVDDHQSVEHINDGPQTAPSKRIIQIFPRYYGLKTSAGPDIAEYTGINQLRAKCPHFNQWFTTLVDMMSGDES